MTNVFSKVLTGSFISAAALLVAACGGNDEADTVVANGLETDVTGEMGDVGVNDMGMNDMGMNDMAMNGMAMNGMNGVDAALDNAAAAAENTAEAIENAQSRAQ